MKFDNFPNRGDIFLIDFPNQKGNELFKPHYALIISNNIHNQYSPRTIIIPISSNISKIYPFELLIKTPKIKGKLMLDQIRACDKKRLLKKFCFYKQWDNNLNIKLKGLLEI